MMVNGESLSIHEVSNHTLSGLLEHFKLAPERIAVELNGNIVKKSEYPKTPLNDSDKVEIIHFVGGGNNKRAAYE